uniref:C2 calcium dependent domain containing 4C n=1 Tax=Cyanistes caeruleus TaxID=156563 RepID=A0A8C0U0V8_CYACU
MSPALPAPASVPSPASPQPGSSQCPAPLRAPQAPAPSRGQSWPGPSALCYLKGTQPFLRLVYPQFRRVEGKQTSAFCSPASPSVSFVLLPRVPSALSSLRDPAQHPAVRAQGPASTDCPLPSAVPETSQPSVWFGTAGPLMHPGRYFSGGESDTCSSAESSPFGSPLLSRSVSLLKLFSQESQSKVIKLKHSVARNSSLSTDDSSADTSPSAQRRARSAPAGTHPPTALLPLDLPAGRDREHSLRLSRGGSLRLAAEYDPSNARLRVRLVSAEDLYDALVDLRSINCCVSLCLNPGKLQKQRSTIVKNSRNPVFNEDFFFDGLGPGHARKMSLKLKVVNKGSSLKRDTLLGEKELPLTALLSCL